MGMSIGLVPCGLEANGLLFMGSLRCAAKGSSCERPIGEFGEVGEVGDGLWWAEEIGERH